MYIGLLYEPSSARLSCSLVSVIPIVHMHLLSRIRSSESIAITMLSIKAQVFPTCMAARHFGTQSIAVPSLLVWRLSTTIQARGRYTLPPTYYGSSYAQLLPQSRSGPTSRESQSSRSFPKRPRPNETGRSSSRLFSLLFPSFSPSLLTSTYTIKPQGPQKPSDVHASFYTPLHKAIRLCFRYEATPVNPGNASKGPPPTPGERQEQVFGSDQPLNYLGANLPIQSLCCSHQPAAKLAILSMSRLVILQRRTIDTL